MTIYMVFGVGVRLGVKCRKLSSDFHHCSELYATGRLEDSERQNDEKMWG